MVSLNRSRFSFVHNILTPLQLQIITAVVVIMLVGIVTLLPLIFLILNSFNAAPLGKAFVWGLEGWKEAFSSPQTLSALKFSFLLSTRTFIGLVVAFLISWLLVRVQIPARSFIEFSLWMAWFLPPLSITIGWTVLLDPQLGLVNIGLKNVFPFMKGAINIYSFSGILWVHLTLVTVPVMTILLGPALRQLDASFEESARACGSKPLMTLRRIVIPLLWPTILVVMIASLIRSLEAFEIEQIIGIPAGIYVYGTRIYDLVHWDPPLYSQAMALSTIFLSALFLLIIFHQWFTRSREFATITSGGMSFRPTLIGRWSTIASGCLLVWIVVSIYLPLVMVLVGSFMKFFGMFNLSEPFTVQHWISVLRDPLFARGLRNSLVLGFGVGILGVAVYLLLGYAIFRHGIMGRSVVSFLIWLPWAIPGILMGLAMLWLFLSFRPISFLYGTIFVLIFTLVIKEMPIGTQMIKVAFSQVSEELEQASRVVGAGWFTTFRRITIPLVAPMIVSIFILVFMASLRDISTPVLLATPSTTPLSILMLDRLVSGEIETASVVGVILSLPAIFTALVVRRLGLRQNTQSL